jgi:light-regulated signal transduction histidine kinase (bacteriophytochrome)
MDVLVNDMYTYSAVDNSETQLEKIDLNEALAEALGRLNKIISEKNAVIESEGLPVFIGNGSHFADLFSNLLSNSLKFQSPGNIPVIKIRAEEVKGANIEHPDAKEGLTYLKITITDNGIGFDQQFVNKIFQMFQRLHHIHEFPGTGMGLSICKKIAGIYNGFIIAQGSPMFGASFSCHFPIQKKA